MDLAYGPAETELASVGESARRTVVDGLEVLVRQGAASLRIWTGLDPPIEAMRRAARATWQRQAPRTPETSPTPGEATARKLDDGHEEAASDGVTAPMHRGHSGMFVTDVIVELGYATRERVDEVINEARVAGRSPEALLRDHNVIDGDQLSRAIAERYGLDHLDLNVYKVDMGAANLLSMTAARRYRAIPVGYVDQETLLLAMADPANVLAVDDIQMMTGLHCRVAVAAEDDIDALIGRMNTLETRRLRGGLEEEEELEGEAEVTELHESADDAPVIKLVYSVLAQAVGEGASDIHFEPDEGEMRVRFRVDGVLHETARVPKRMISGVVSRVKLMADMDIAEKRVPQDGRVSVNVDDRKIDLRVTTLPTQRGEGCSIRILDKEQAMRTLDELGMEGERADAVRGRVHPALRRGPGHRADRLREVDDALRGAPGAERRGAQHHHDRGPGRVPDLGHQPAERQPQGGARLRDRPALDPARRPRRDHGRRDPRRGDGADRDRGGAHRPHGADHAAHQRRPGRGGAPGQDGHRELPDRVGDRVRGRAAPRAPALHLLQAAHRDPAGRAGRGGIPRSAPTSRPTSRWAAPAAARPATGAGSASSR